MASSIKTFLPDPCVLGGFGTRPPRFAWNNRATQGSSYASLEPSEIGSTQNVSQAPGLLDVARRSGPIRPGPSRVIPDTHLLQPRHASSDSV